MLTVGWAEGSGHIVAGGGSRTMVGEMGQEWAKILGHLGLTTRLLGPNKWAENWTHLG